MGIEAEHTPPAPACACLACQARAELSSSAKRKLQITSFFTSSPPPGGYPWTVYVSVDGQVLVWGHGDLEEEALHEAMGELRAMGVIP